MKKVGRRSARLGLIGLLQAGSTLQRALQEQKAAKTKLATPAAKKEGGGDAHSMLATFDQEKGFAFKVILVYSKLPLAGDG